jgi:hypothetical protein
MVVRDVVNSSLGGGGVTPACKCPARRGHDSGGVATKSRPLEIIMGVDVELPEISAWAHAELSGYTDGQVDRVIRKWNSADSTRRELRWLEQALRWRRSRQAPARADEIGCNPAGRACAVDHRAEPVRPLRGQ